MQNALVVYEKVKDPGAFSIEMAKTFAAFTGCALEQGAAVVLTCMIEGITPLEFKRTYHLIQGSPTMRADAMLARFLLSGGKHKIVERSPTRAAIVLVNADGEEFANEFTRVDAEASRWPWKDWKDHGKGVKDNWSTPTDFKAMLWARLVSDSIRAFAPEIVAGIYTPEEMQDANVVATTVTTAEPARPTAAQVMAAANGNGDGNGQSASEPLAAEDVVDAQFEAAGEPAATGPLGTGYATRGQIDKILTLATELNAPLDQALAKRGVNAVHGLTVAAAQDLIDKLEARQRGLAGATSGN